MNVSLSFQEYFCNPALAVAPTKWQKFTSSLMVYFFTNYCIFFTLFNVVLSPNIFLILTAKKKDLYFFLLT